MIFKFKQLSIILFVVFFHSLSVADGIPLATGEAFPFTSEKLENYGFVAERVSIVFERMGLVPVYSFYPWRRSYDSVLKAKSWAAFPYAYTKERAEEVWFSDHFSCSRTVLFYYEDTEGAKNIHFNKLEDLKSYKVGGITGYWYESMFKEEGIEADYTNKEILALKKLQAGRIDLIPFNNIVGRQLIKEHFPEHIHKFKILEKPLSVNPLVLAVSRDYPNSKELLLQFNQALKQSIEDGLIVLNSCE